MLNLYRPLTKEEYNLYSDSFRELYKKHSPPGRTTPAIEIKLSIEEYLEKNKDSDYIFIYDSYGTFCKCQNGKLIYQCQNSYTENGMDMSSRTATWQIAMREQYHVPEQYKIRMFYIQNEIDGWIAHCEQTNTLMVEDKNGFLYIYHQDGSLKFQPTLEQYIYSLDNEYTEDPRGNNMSQLESNIIAHFCQLISVLRKSEWFRNRNSFSMTGNKIQNADMPSLTQTIFALLYIRQLIDNNDHIINSAFKIYSKHSKCRQKTDFIKEKVKYITKFLSEPPLFYGLGNIVGSRRHLIEVFQYGALIIHGPEKIDKSIRELYNKLYENEKIKTISIFSLNSIMEQIVCFSSLIATFIQKDVCKWIDEKKVPVPDIIWQHSMFSWNTSNNKEKDLT